MRKLVRHGGYQKKKERKTRRVWGCRWLAPEVRMKIYMVIYVNVEFGTECNCPKGCKNRQTEIKKMGDKKLG